MLVEIARFWVSRTTYDQDRDRYDIYGVIGPDEFHSGYPNRPYEGVDNNSYTNVMAVWVILRAVEALEAAEGPAQEYAANAALTASVGMLYEETRKVSGDDKGSVLQTQWSEFLSRGNIIDNSADAYNEQARAAQKKLSGFPASLIAGLTGVQAEEFSA